MIRNRPVTILLLTALVSGGTAGYFWTRQAGAERTATERSAPEARVDAEPVPGPLAAAGSARGIGAAPPADGTQDEAWLSRPGAASGLREDLRAPPAYADDSSPVSRGPTSVHTNEQVTLAADENATREILRPLGWCFQALLPGDPGWQSVEAAIREDASVVWNGSRSARVDARISDRHLRLLWQAIDARPFRGKRVEVSAHIHLAEESTAAHLFVRSLSGQSQFLLGIDAGGNEDAMRAGHKGWARYAAKRNIPIDADVLVYGVRIARSYWIDAVKVSVLADQHGPASAPRPVSASLPPTVISTESVYPGPTNLDFEEVESVLLENSGKC